ncbi:MAG: right-handed parallel beta-helix repeat-containing protein [Pirellulales bacterium]|nr:right-handed parallel beta-helix repeat-containing protein [Pirellulales bacterium]
MNNSTLMKKIILTIVPWLIFAALACAGNASDAHRETLVRSIVDVVRPLGVGLDDQGELTSGNKQGLPKAKPEAVTNYKSLVVTAQWSEQRPGPNGALKTVPVTAEIWTRAIQACLDKHALVRIPHRDKPYYIDGPLVMKTGSHLTVDPGTEIRLKPGTSTCMVRNQNVVDGEHGPVELGKGADSDITIESGIWTTLATTANESNGNARGSGFSPWKPLGSHGTIMISNARRVVVRNLTIKQCRPHGIQIGNCSEFLVENIIFDQHRRDGVHMGGPLKNGVVHNIRGATGDDMIALNAWDWKQSNTTFGPIERILVDNVTAEQPSAVRLLAGTKNFGPGKSVDCDISNCVVRNIRGMHEIKIYDQPNLELGRNNDFADPIGKLANLFFSDIHVDHPAPPLFQIASNVDGIDISHVKLNFAPTDIKKPPFRLVEVGPMSMTYKFDPNNPASWVEVFSPDTDCTVRNLTVSDVRFALKQSQKLSPKDLIRVRNQKLNSDYPKTTPRGGTGHGILINE